MRLTLRTMLAYLDDILEPGDAEQLGQKIEESKFASDLVHRIRNSTRRLRLGVPKLEGKGMGLDPNTVAEYLDNTLRPEDVPDFEKVCLESDVHLAEVASCHQILTLVLGEPAEIEHAVRERVYRLDRGRDGADPESGLDGDNGDGAKSAPRVAVAAAASPRKHAEPPPPDYMRSGTGVRVRSLAITLVLTFLAVALGLRAIGPFNRDHLFWRFLFGGGSQVVQSTDSPAVAAEPMVETQVRRPAGSTNGSAAQLSSSGPSSSAEAVLELTDGAAQRRDLTPAAESEGPEPVAALETRSAEEPRVESSPAAGPDVETVESRLKVLDKSPEPVSGEPLSGEPVSEEPVSGEPLPEERAEGGPVVARTASSVGRYISDEEILGRLDAESDEWFSLPADATLAAGNQLVVLPTYRPQILLSHGMKVTLSGESRIHLMPPDADGAPQLELVYGRAIIVPVGDADAKISIQVGARRASLRFSDMESAAAVEVRRYLSPGSDPENTAPQDVALVYATSGQVGWQEEAVKATLNAGQLLAFAGSDAVKILDAATLPTWIDGIELTGIERRGSHELRDYITTDRPLGLALMERTEFRKQEVRALACRALAALEIYDPLLRALNDDRQRIFERSHFDTLRFSVSRGPQSAMRLREMIERLYGDEASDIYRLCWGYAPEQLPAGAATELVEHLKSETMCVRALAIWNLQRITGMSHAFFPWRTPDQERTKTNRWRQSLQEGRIVYAEAPVPIPELPAPGEETAPAASGDR